MAYPWCSINKYSQLGLDWYKGLKDCTYNNKEYYNNDLYLHLVAFEREIISKISRLSLVLKHLGKCPNLEMSLCDPFVSLIT